MVVICFLPGQSSVSSLPLLQVQVKALPFPQMPVIFVRLPFSAQCKSG